MSIHKVKHSVKTVASHLQGCMLNRLVEGGHIYTSEEVTIHVIGTNNVIHLCSVSKQVARLVRQEVAIDDRRENQFADSGS